ncbi:MAG: hypothetical protein LT071_10115 [Nocardioides sp.]|nr:hypothetical protein [Nocardioides sp.]
MGDKETSDQDSPSLEMPSLSLRRRRRPEEAEVAPEPQSERMPEPPPETRSERKHGPRSGLVVAVVTGAVVGLLAVVLNYLAITGCGAVRGTSSCGGGPGLVILAAVTVLLAWLGGVVLHRFDVPDAGLTSFLAVGLTAVLVMLLLMDALYDWWMVIAIPVAAAASYALSWWVTTAIVQNADDR